jgi:DNA invertase Pin-like site-specific DNA recombinase
MTTAYSYVRFSSKPQERGDSLRRQVALAREYAEKHQLTLDERSYQDLGISAFKGKNVAEGALGAFLKAVDDKLIPTGSYLLVESLDRVSRASVMDAYDVFRSIIKRGIVLVTLNDQQVYSRATIDDNWTKLIMALAVMARSNEESATKSKRIKESWAEKREQGVILTAMGPGWLTLSDDRKKWLLKADKVKVVRDVFEYAASGLGAPTIANKLNGAGVPTMARAAHWEPGVVMALLKNSAVIGRYTPKKADAAPIDGYYPEVIKPEVFHAVQEHIAKRRGTGGRKGENVANLFSGLLRCECGSRMRYVSGAKPHLYVRCLKAYSNVGCDAPIISYTALEDEVMQMVLVWAKLPLESAVVEDPTIVIRGELEEKRKQEARLMKLIESSDEIAAPKLIMQQLAKLETEIDALEKLERTALVPTPVGQAVGQARLLWKEHQKVQKRGGEELRDLRFRLQAECKRMLCKIVLPKTIRSETAEDGKPLEYGQFILYGPVVDGLPFDNVPMLREDGGWIEEYRLPAYGINGTRRRVRVS